MTRERVDLPTPDGALDCYVFEPDGSGSWPAVIVYMDAFGVRDDLDVMAARLAAAGYVVAVPNLYHRSGAFPPFDPALVAAGGAERDRFMGMIKSINGDLVMQDTAAVLDHLATRPSVRPGPVGTVGYCMEGRMALRMAGEFADAVSAAASFHGGNLATDSELSPHRLASRMKGRIYVAGADRDNSYPPEMAERLERALDDADVDHRCEIYPGALHGWTMADFPVYDQPAAERHWRELLALFSDTLGAKA